MGAAVPMPARDKEHAVIQPTVKSQPMSLKVRWDGARGAPRKLSRPAGESAGLRHDANTGGSFFLARFGFRQPAPPQFIQRNAGEVRLDIEDRRAIQHVETSDVQQGAFAAKEFEDGQAERIRPPGRAGSEDSVGTVIAGRSGEQFGTG